jgi:hypothetical protein
MSLRGRPLRLARSSRQSLRDLAIMAYALASHPRMAGRQLRQRAHVHLVLAVRPREQALGEHRAIRRYHAPFLRGTAIGGVPLPATFNHAPRVGPELLLQQFHKLDLFAVHVIVADRAPQ